MIHDGRAGLNNDKQFINWPALFISLFICNSVEIFWGNGKTKFAGGISSPKNWIGANLDGFATESNRLMRANTKKIIGIILCGVVIFATLDFWFQSRQTENMKQAAADTRRMLREQGFKTDFADFTVTTDPATRARMAMLTVFNEPLQLDSSYDGLDFLPRVSDDTAAVIWKQNSLAIGSGTLQWLGLRAMLGTNREALDAACDAAVSGPIRFDMDLSPSGDREDEHVPRLEALFWDLSYRGILELHDGNRDAAWSNLLAATRLVTAWEPEPDGLSRLLQSRMADETFADTWQALQFSNWPDARLAALQQEWESANFFTNLPEIAAFDRAEAVNYCQLLSKQPPFAGDSLSRLVKEAVRDPSYAYREIKSDIGIMRYHGVEALTDERNLLLYHQQRELELRHAIQSPTWAEMRAQPGVTNAVPFKSPSPDMVEYTASNRRMESLLPALIAREEAQRRLLITAIALERYRGKHGVYPATLASLAPEFVKTVPVDFMDGKPLRYRLTDDGHFVLYSVGLDCVDDGGKLPLPDAPSFPRSSTGEFIAPTNVDIVWPRPDFSPLPTAASGVGD